MSNAFIEDGDAASAWLYQQLKASASVKSFFAQKRAKVVAAHARRQAQQQGISDRMELGLLSLIEEGRRLLRSGSSADADVNPADALLVEDKVRAVVKQQKFEVGYVKQRKAEYEGEWCEQLRAFDDRL